MADLTEHIGEELSVPHSSRIDSSVSILCILLGVLGGARLRLNRQTHSADLDQTGLTPPFTTQCASTGETVRANVERLRGKMNLKYAELARRLEDVGRPIPELGLRRIENGSRRVDADDLMALAAAFDVSPATLLMPDTPSEEWETDVEATGQPEGVTAQLLWSWLVASGPPRNLTFSRDVFMWVAGAVPSPAFDAVMASYRGADDGDD